MEIRLQQADPGGHFVTAKLVEPLPATRQRVDERKSFNASAASFSTPIRIKTDDDRGPVIFSGEAGSDNSQHAGMPAGRANHDSRFRNGIGPGLHLLFCSSKNFLFDLLPVPVFAIEIFGQRGRFCHVRGKEKAKSLFRGAQTPGRVESRPQTIANVLRQNRRCDAAQFHQFAQTEP